MTHENKLGLFIHWGAYSLYGVHEQIIARFDIDHGEYEKRVMTFCPSDYDPEIWVLLAKGAGMKYICFTAKHHDGFCMWDTKTTDYKVTGSEVPYKDNKNADVTRVLFDAFRARGMGISLYYSRADFSCPYYWEEGYAMKDGTERVPSYDPDEKPEKWQKFRDFTLAQLTELVSDYGRIDTLWYDGGCDGVKLGVPEITEELRKIQPHMLGIMRGGRGVCEDVITPELVFPDGYVNVPWEVCTVMAKPLEEYGESRYTSFGYTYDVDYMTAKEVAHMLLDVVSKGGNLALNIAPQPDGRLPGRALRELAVLSEWMKVFAPAIHGTRAASPYRVGQLAYTKSKDGKRVNAFYLYEDGESVAKEYVVPFEGKAKRVTDMRSGKELAFAQEGESLRVQMPAEAVGTVGDIADCFAIEA